MGPGFGNEGLGFDTSGAGRGEDGLPAVLDPEYIYIYICIYSYMYAYMNMCINSYHTYMYIYINI